MSAKEAFAQANIGEPLQPFGKDSLAIMSSNAYAAALAVLTVREAEYLLESARKVFALSLEALNGNVSPFLEPVHSVRPYPTQGMIAEEILKELEGSFLWACKDKREPGSFAARNDSTVSAAWLLKEGLLKYKTADEPW